MKILVINPGSTSTKIGVYEDTNLLWKKNIHHDSDHLKQFAGIAGQYPYRKELILSELRAEGFSSDDFRAVIGRGGLLSPLQGGVYAVNEKMIDELKHATREHASNLGAIHSSCNVGTAVADKYAYFHAETSLPILLRTSEGSTASLSSPSSDAGRL